VIRVFSVSIALKIIKICLPGILRFEITPLMSKWVAVGRQYFGLRHNVNGESEVGCGTLQI